MTESVGVLEDLQDALADVLDRIYRLGRADAGKNKPSVNEKAALKAEAIIEACSTVLLVMGTQNGGATTQQARVARQALLITARQAAEDPVEFNLRYGVDPTEGYVDPQVVTELLTTALTRRRRL